MQTITVSSHQRNEMIDVTKDLQSLVDSAGITTGFLIAYVPHTTAGITINEGADPDVQRDIIHTLNRLIPKTDDYHHAEGNSDAHVKASLLGSSVTILIKEGQLQLGTWQHVFFYEGDGPRTRTVHVTIIQQ